jgi:predicted dehydrogenase
MQTRRTFIRKASLTASTLPLFNIARAGVSANSILSHASFGASGMAFADLKTLSGNPHVNLTAVAEVDESKLKHLKKAFPDVRVYKDWRILLDKEHKQLDSVNVSTPDHMHAPIGITAMRMGLHVYGQKPLAQTLYETRRMSEIAKETGVVTQMGTQLTSSTYERLAARIVQDGVIGKIKEVYIFSHKTWGDPKPRPDRKDPVPVDFDWDLWLGVAEDRPFIDGYYHPEIWRSRLDFGTGTLGDMGCHIYSPMFQALGLRAPISVKSTGSVPNEHSWAIDEAFEYVFRGSDLTEEDTIKVSWTDGSLRPPRKFLEIFGDRMPEQGSIFVGTDGILLQPHGELPIPYPREKFADYRYPKFEARRHYEDFINAIRGEKVKPLADFVDYGGPLTETVLIGALASRFPQETLSWDVKSLRFTNSNKANEFIKKTYRKGWEIENM